MDILFLNCLPLTSQCAHANHEYVPFVRLLTCERARELRKPEWVVCWQKNSINVTFKLTLMSGLSPIHTSYLEDTTTVRQHFTCFEFTKTSQKKNDEPKHEKSERAGDQDRDWMNECEIARNGDVEKRNGNKWNVSHVRALPFGSAIRKTKNWMQATWNSFKITNDRRPLKKKLMYIHVDCKTYLCVASREMPWILTHTAIRRVLVLIFHQQHIVPPLAHRCATEDTCNGNCANNMRFFLSLSLSAVFHFACIAHSDMETRWSECARSRPYTRLANKRWNHEPSLMK